MNNKKFYVKFNIVEESFIYFSILLITKNKNFWLNIRQIKN